VFIKLWSAAVRQAVLRRFRKKKHCKNLSDSEQMKNKSIHSVLKLPVLFDIHQKVDELVLSITYCHSVIILEDTLN
jgi:hypothetical protein